MLGGTKSLSPANRRVGNMKIQLLTEAGMKLLICESALDYRSQ